MTATSQTTDENPDAAAALSLKHIGRFPVEELIGRGALGAVFRGIDTSIKKPVTIKTIHPNFIGGSFGAQLISDLERGINEASRLRHGNVVSTYEFGWHGKMAYIATEYVNGIGLDHILQESSELPLKRINAFFIGTCRGLNSIHQQGMVHRNIKPSNIMVQPGDAIKLADLGMSLTPSPEMFSQGLILGISPYLAPELQRGGLIDKRCDIFSLGVVLLELLSFCADLPEGERSIPFAYNTHLALNRRRFTKPIADFLNQCLDTAPQHRFENIARMLEAYKVALQHIQMIKSPAQRTIAVPAPSEPSFAPAAPSIIAEPSPTSYLKKAQSSMEAARLLRSIDPILNPDWREKVNQARKQLDTRGWQWAYSHILKPKKICWHEETDTLTFLGGPGVKELSLKLVTPQLSALAQKLIPSLDTLQKSRSAMQVADIMEGCLGAIDRIEIGDSEEEGAERQILRNAFLYDTARCIQSADFDIPENQRSLTSHAIKTYFLDVFIKQQVMKYWFSTTSLHDLETDVIPLLRDVIYHEAKIRRFEIVKTDHYYFLIGSVPHFDQNPYSARRFLVEDTALDGRIYFFNVLCISIDDLDSPDAEIKLRHDLSRMVTIERQLNDQIIQLVETFESCQRKYLMPLLFKPIDAEGTDLETAIARRVNDYEKQLSLLILSKLPRALKNYVRILDDYDYLLSSIRVLLLEILGNIQDFSYSSASSMSDKTQELEYRLAAYIRLLEKRNQNHLLYADQENITGQPGMDPTSPVQELRTTVNDSIPVIEALCKQLKDASQTPCESDSRLRRLLTRLTRAKEKTLPPEDIETKIAAEHRDCYLRIVRIPKKYAQISVYLEFEELAPSSESRHYAFPCGNNGLSLLPILIRLPNDREKFSPQKVLAMLNADIFATTQKNRHASPKIPCHD